MSVSVQLSNLSYKAFISTKSNCYGSNAKLMIFTNDTKKNIDIREILKLILPGDSLLTRARQVSN